MLPEGQTVAGKLSELEDNKADIDVETVGSANIYNQELATIPAKIIDPTTSASIKTSGNGISDGAVTPLIAVEPNKDYYFGITASSSASYNSYIFLDANKAYISGAYFSGTSFVATSPANAAYIRVSYYYRANVEIMLAQSSVPVEYIPYDTAPTTIRTLSAEVRLDDSHIQQAVDGMKSDADTTYVASKINAMIKESTSFFMPHKIYTLEGRLIGGSPQGTSAEPLKGRVLELDNLIVSRANGLMYFDRRLSSTQARPDGGDTIYFDGDSDDAFGGYTINNAITLSEIYTFGSCYHKSASVAKVVNPGLTKKILWLGDSYSEAGSMVMETYSILHNTLGLTNIEFIGTKTSWTAPSATASDGNQYNVKHQGMSGRGICDFLKLDDSQGVAAGTHNPFLFDGSLNFRRYIEESALETTVDYVVIELGINDMVGGGASPVETSNRMKSLINLIHTDYPNVKIIIVGQVFLDKSNPRAATSSNIGPHVYLYNSNVINMNKEYEVLAESAEYSDYVTYCDCGAMFRKKYGWLYAMNTIIGSDEQEKICTNKMHPSPAGYYMMAENIACCAALNWFVN